MPQITLLRLSVMVSISAFSSKLWTLSKVTSIKLKYRYVSEIHFTEIDVKRMIHWPHNVADNVLLMP